MGYNAYSIYSGAPMSESMRAEIDAQRQQRAAEHAAAPKVPDQGAEHTRELVQKLLQRNGTAPRR